MNIKSRALGALAGVLAFGLLATTASAADRPYTEVTVVNVSAIRTEPGMFDDYMKYLAGPYKQLMEEQKKAGIIVDWNVYRRDRARPDDPNLYLVTTYKNMARWTAWTQKDAIQESHRQQVVGAMDKSTRGKMPSSGSEMIRKLIQVTS